MGELKVDGMTVEMETFLPRDESKVNGVGKNYTIVKGKSDVEGQTADFDPFKARQLDHPVSNCETLMHLLKASLGTGILSMPAAFKASGLLLGVIVVIIVSIICTHCAYILVKCAHELYRRSGRTTMTFAEVAEEACLRGPKWARRFAWSARFIVLISLFVTYFTTCSCYSVIIATNLNYVVTQYVGAFELRYTIAILLVPCVLLSYVPNLKKLAPISMVANAFMAIGLGITFYYLVDKLPDLGQRPLAANIVTLPITVSITIFAIEAIGVMMPLENNMETPTKFLGICGVLNQGMSAVTMIYIILGFFGYLKYGDATKGSITLNLPQDEYAAQAVQVLIALAVFCTFGLQFYVALEIAWNGIKEHFPNRPMTANYVLRTVLVVICIALAIAVPRILPFVSLIGAFCFSILGLMCPVFIELLTFWDKGFGRFHWKLSKPIIIVCMGMLALVFGSKSAIEEIITMFK